MIQKIQLFIALSLVLNACSPVEKSNLVYTIDEFKEAAKNAKPGTEITLANGIWENVELKLEAKGSQDSLISIKAETPGKVIITGQSNLAFSGEFIHISGLVFKDGFTPTSEVISFKTSKEKLANNSIVSECVIDNFSNPERFDADTWVAIYGKNNIFEHNSLIGKGNRGVTLAVKLSTEESRENNHIIQKNYFGPRQTMGSNGGESFRIGTSHYSRSYSNTLVVNNYFDRTSGELEIISNKSCGNVFKGNVFYECQGTLTMRHGHHTTVENNYFLGNRKANTGGIRVINEYQKVQNNYLYGLTGYRFRSALVMMNGVPNSPINRYNQVVDSQINNNVVLDCDNIQLCAGSDDERSAIPIGSSFSNNLIISNFNLKPFTIYDDVSGIQFSGNLMNEKSESPFVKGFEKIEMTFTKNKIGLLSPSKDLLDRINFGEVKLPITKKETGASYYSKDGFSLGFSKSKTISVPSGTNTLLEAIENCENGDVLELENDGKYLLTKYAFVAKHVSIVCPQGKMATLLSEKQSFFKIENGGALSFKNILFDGAEAPDRVGNNVVSTSKYSMNVNYALKLENCIVKNLDKNHSFDFLKSYKHTFADSVVIRNCQLENITGSIISMDMEVEDLGIYNVENLIIENTNFRGVKGTIANVYRGGTDESTFGPVVRINNVKIDNCGNGKRNKIQASFRFHGVQKLNLDKVDFQSSRGIDLFLTNGEPISNLRNINFKNSGGLKVNREDYNSINITGNN